MDRIRDSAIRAVYASPLALALTHDLLLLGAASASLCGFGTVAHAQPIITNGISSDTSDLRNSAQVIP